MFKANIDQDKRDVAMLQEMYLADGDLHNEGKARMRRFKWKNIDDDTEQDLFNSDDEEDKAGGEDEVAEEKWRKERFEREKFLQEHEAEEKQQEGDSELLKLGKIVFKGKTSLRRPSSAASMSQNVGSKPQENKPPAASGSGIFKVPSLRSNHGSFLRRSAADLAKIAEMSKPAATVGGPRNSKNFVFQAKSPGVKEAPENTGEKKREATKPQVKRALSVQQPPAKRPCLEKSNSIPKDSIFHLFN